MSKVFQDAIGVIKDVVKDGQTLMVGGFGLCGIPENLIMAIRDLGIKDLTIISNNCGVDDFGLGILLKNKQIKKMISSYVGENQNFANQLLSGELEADLIPQGTLAERIRAAGAGIPAFYTPSGVGTIIAEGKETRVFDGKEYVLEHWLKADVALIKSWKADSEGNLLYRKSARNFNPLMAKAAPITIVETDEIVPFGTLDQDSIHTPGIYVNRIIQAECERRIERVKLR